MPLKVANMRPEAVAVLTDDTPVVDRKRSAAGKLFRNPDAYGSALLLAARTVFTFEELTSFDVETIRLELQTEFSIAKIDEDIFGRLIAMLAAIDTDLFYNDLPAFIEICNILSGQAADPELFDPADPYEISWAITEIGVIDPPDETLEFSLEIREYMGFTLHEHGFFSPPKAMSMAIMPDSHLNPSQVTDDPDLLPTIVETDIQRAAEVEQMLVENIAELADQMRPFVGSADQTEV